MDDKKGKIEEGKEEEEEEDDEEELEDEDVGVEDLDELLEDAKAEADKEEEGEASTSPVPVCKECGKTGSEVPLMFVDRAFYCTACRPVAPAKPVAMTVRQKKLAKIQADKDAMEAAKKQPWRHFDLTTFDAMRKRVTGTNKILQFCGKSAKDEVHLRKGDRVVVMYIPTDGPKCMVLDVMHGEEGFTGELSILTFTLSSWGPSTVSPHMVQNRSLTPPGYG